jgi:hypothetical protein
VTKGPDGVVRGRRGLTVAAAGCAVSGGLVLLAVGRMWLRYDVPEPGLAVRAASATGHVVADPASTFALVVLAGILVLPATRGLLRRLAGVVIALAGLGIGYVAVLTIVLTKAALPGPDTSDYLDGRVTVWPWIAAAAALVAIAAGLLTAVASRDWPAMGRRYEQGGSPSRDSSEASMWDRLDVGDDPTV